MTNMADVFGEDWAERFQAVALNGLITLRAHPEFPELLIANYTPQTAYAGLWDEVTLSSRGLIFNVVTGEILARPFKKFFNYGQTGAPDIDLDALVYYAGNKFDGSLGIMYERPDHKLAIATRGSFDSEQARHATAIVQAEAPNDDYPFEWFRGDIRIGMTPLFEIIYPENRIVVNYGSMDKLQLLGWVQMSSGRYTAPGGEGPIWGTTFRAVLDREPRPNAEGWVVWLDQYTPVKIKQEDYVALHKIVTGLNEKTVWQEIQNGPTAYQEFIANLPDELQLWASRVGFTLALEYGQKMREIDAWYERAMEVAWERKDRHDLSPLIPRKELALAVQDEVPAEYRGFMFSLADGKDIQGKVWKLLEPKGASQRPVSYSEEAA